MIAPLGQAALEDAADAVEQEDFEAAYHFLMAAVHVADKAADFELIDRACRFAREYGDAIDVIAPEHPLSGNAARRRGTTPLFESIQVHAKAVLVRHKAEAQRQHRS